MSIFQLQDYWTISLSQHGEGNDDEYDLGCIAVGNFDNSSNGSDKIAVGSLKGILRVYNPSGGEYKLDDLLVEENLEKPILQLLCGRFIPSSLGTLGLAVLHPRSLAVYELGIVCIRIHHHHLHINLISQLKSHEIQFQKVQIRIKHRSIFLRNNLRSN